jgi:rRNA biogenesis protein RRP5
VRCTVTRSDSLNVRKLKLSLIDGGDFGGGSVDREGTGFETEGGNADETTDGPDPGTVFDFVTVKSVDTETGAVRVKLPLEGGYGTVTKAHLSDCPATGTQLLESLTPGSQLGPVLVLESKSAKRVVLSRKLSLITSAKENKLPETVADLLVGGRYPGYVASVSSSGVFVRFLGRLTGLAPPSGLVSFSSGGSVSKKGKGNKPTDPTDRFQLGQTVFAKVTAVDATTATPRVSLSLSGSVNSSTPKSGNQSAALAALGLDSCLIRQVFADIDALDFLAESRGDRDADDDDEKMVLSKEAASKFTPGTKISVTVSQTREYGILGDCGLDENAVVVIGNDQLDGKKDQKKDGSVVTCVVLDVDRREGIVDCGARAGLLESVDSKKKSASKSTRGKKSETDDLQPGTNVTAVIELLKPEYMVVSLPGHGGSVGYCAGRAVNAGFGERVDTDDAWSPLGVVGETVSLTVVTDGTRNGGRLLLVADDALLGDTSDGHDGVSRNGGGGYVGGGTDHPVGAVLDAVVLEKHVQQVIVSLPGGGKARLHATEMPLTATSVSSKKKSAKGLDTSKGGYVDTATPVFQTTHEGDSISVVVCGPAGDRGTMLEVSARRSSSDAKSAFAAAAAHGSQDGGNAGVLGTAALATLEHGVLFAHAVVAQVSAQVLAVLIAPGLTVRLPRIETGCDVERCVSVCFTKSRHRPFSDQPE